MTKLATYQREQYTIHTRVEDCKMCPFQHDKMCFGCDDAAAGPVIIPALLYGMNIIPGWCQLPNI